MTPRSRYELIEYCLRRLGKPVINIEVANEQLEDRLDEALEVFTEKHYDATEQDWVAYSVTQEDIDNGYITIPEDILVITELLPFNQIASSNDMFSYKYQININELSPWQPFDQIDYFMKMTNLEQIKELTSTVPRFEFVRHGNKLKVFGDALNHGVGYTLGVQVYRAIDPDAYPKIYNDKWLKAYATALIKRQWGENTKKFGGVQLLGGVTINGEQIFQEALQDIERLETELQETYMEPIPFIMG